MAWGQSIAQGLGNAGNAWGDAVDHNLDQALKVIQNRLLSQEIQGRLQEQQARIKQMSTPQFQTLSTPGGGTAGVMTDPYTHAPLGKPQTLVAGDRPVKTIDEAWLQAAERENGGQ